MLSNILRISRTHPPPSRLIHASVSQGPRLSEHSIGQVDYLRPSDPHDQAARAGKETLNGTLSSGPYDAATTTPGKTASGIDRGSNPEGVGFAEQVGGASAAASKGGPYASRGEGKGATEESAPPGFVASVKSALGFNTTSDEVKQNRGGGIGVTGTGRLSFEKGSVQYEGRRAFHSTAMRNGDRTTRGKAPDTSREPKERTNAEQNPHLKHKREMGAPDMGKGSAAEEPELPSHQDWQMEQVKKGASHGPGPKQTRRFSTSARRLAPNHTAETYFKDVDETPPASQRTHQVDSSATGSDVQRPDEPLTGEWSRAGAMTKEYQTNDSANYDLPGVESEQKLRYGNMPRQEESGSRSRESPTGATRGGRKPE